MRVEYPILTPLFVSLPEGRKENIKYFIILGVPLVENAALNYATQHEMPSEFDGKWIARCL